MDVPQPCFMKSSCQSFTTTQSDFITQSCLTEQSYLITVLSNDKPISQHEPTSYQKSFHNTLHSDKVHCLAPIKMFIMIQSCPLWPNSSHKVILLHETSLMTTTSSSTILTFVMQIASICVKPSKCLFHSSALIPLDSDGRINQTVQLIWLHFSLKTVSNCQSYIISFLLSPVLWNDPLFILILEQQSALLTMINCCINTPYTPSHPPSWLGNSMMACSPECRMTESPRSHSLLQTASNKAACWPPLCSACCFRQCWLMLSWWRNRTWH